MPFICSLLISGLRYSPLLTSALPRVRRLALIETIQAIADNSGDTTEDGTERNRKALTITLQNVATSPYLSQENFIDAVLQELTSVANHFNVNGGSHSEDCENSGIIINNIADAILQKDWPTVIEIAPIAEVIIPISEQQREEPHEQFRRFRAMVIEIFSSSHKMQNMVDMSRRRIISQRIHSTHITTTEQLIEVAIDFIRSSQIFVTSTERADVLNCIFDGRFDKLLLPQYFDCEERSRRVTTHQDEDYIQSSFYQNTSESANEAVVTSVNGAATEIPEESEESDCCVICLSELAASTRTLDCNHTYCTECINSWLERRGDCPTCRAPATSTDRPRPRPRRRRRRFRLF